MLANQTKTCYLCTCMCIFLLPPSDWFSAHHWLQRYHSVKIVWGPWDDEICITIRKLPDKSWSHLLLQGDDTYNYCHKNIYIYIFCPQQMVLCPQSPFHFAFNHHFHFTAFQSAWLTGQSIKQIRLIVPSPAITFFSSSELNSLITFLIQLLILGISVLLGFCL